MPTPRSAIALLLVCLAQSVAFATDAGALTVAVTTTADVVDPTDGLTSVREAMALANSDGEDSIIRLPGGLTYTLSACGAALEDANVSGDLDHTDLSHGLQIVGVGVRPTVTTTCEDRHIDQTGSGTLEIRNLRFIHGFARLPVLAPSGAYQDLGGGSVESLGPVLLNDTVFERNVVATAAGGMLVPRGGAVSAPYIWATRSLFSQNRAPEGGAISDRDSSGMGAAPVAVLGMVDSAVVDNVSMNRGGAVRTGKIWAVATLFERNSTERSGGAVFSASGSIRQSTFTNNRSAPTSLSLSIGGDIYLDGSDGQPSTIDSSVLRGGSASFCGSVYTAAPLLTISATTISGATATAHDGGGICVGGMPNPAGFDDHRDLTVVESVITANTAAATGGGVAVLEDHGQIDVSRSLLSANTAKYAGGGIAVPRSAAPSGVDLSVSQSEIDSNHALLGGGLMVTGPTSIQNTTISRNSAKFGGGVNFGLSPIRLVHSSVLDNVATVGGALSDRLQMYPGKIATLQASAISGSGNDCDLTAAPTSLGYNLKSDVSCGIRPADLHGFTAYAPWSDFHVLGFATPTLMPIGVGDFVPAPSCVTSVDQLSVARPVGLGCTPGAVETTPAATATPPDPRR